MIRALFSAGTFAALALSVPVQAQTILPQFSVQGTPDAAGCRQLAVRDRDSGAPVAIGCLGSGGDGITLTPKGARLSASGAMDLTYAITYNPNAIVAAPGNRVSYCPELSCVRGPLDGPPSAAYADHQRASLLVAAQTQDDAHSQESTIAITTTVNKGYAKNYAANTAYSLGDNVLVGDSFGGVIYRVVQAGATGANSKPQTSSPSQAQGTDYQVMDGTVRFKWINAAAINAKVGLYNEVVAKEGAGQTWGEATNLELRSGVKPTFAATSEFDFGNNSGTDCVPGVSNCYGSFIRMGGSNYTTAGMTIEGSGAGSLFGARIVGNAGNAEALSIGTTGGGSGIALGDFTPASFQYAAIRDNSSSLYGLWLSGAKTGPQINIQGSATTGILMTGLNASQWQILGSGFSVDTVGNVKVASLTVGNSFTPPSSSSSCLAGQTSWDASYLYQCVATNTWKRAALSSW